MDTISGKSSDDVKTRSGPRIAHDTAPGKVACQELVWGDDEEKVLWFLLLVMSK